MATHDWTRVEAGIFHDFHHAWIEEIKRHLNSGVLPDDHYALAEQFAGGFGPDVLALMTRYGNEGAASSSFDNGGDAPGILLAPPKAALAGETEVEFLLEKQKVVVVRHVSDDSVIAVVEIVSPGNESSAMHFESLVNKTSALLRSGVHVLLVDLFPPSPRDPHGIHGAIWNHICGGSDGGWNPAKPLTLAAYERALSIRAYVEHFAVGDDLLEMPLFLHPGKHVPVSLSETYATAFNAVPRRWRTVLE